MRRLTSWAVVIIAGSALLSAPACLTSQDKAARDGGPIDPPIAFNGEGGARPGGGMHGHAGKAVNGSGNRPSGTPSGDGGADSGCSDDADCAFRADDRSHCSAPTGDCVECLTANDCGPNEECTNNDCRPFTQCADSRDCPQSLVCNFATDRCVECVGANDCAVDESCVLNVCRKQCTIDGDCIPFGLRCDTNTGYCASCVSDSDCPETRNCQQGTCVRDICTGGAAACKSGSLATCNAAGSVLGALIPCGAQQSCTEDSSGARCAPWICLPSTTGCSLTSERVVTCSDDGLSETLVKDCTVAKQLCIGTTGGMCSDALCEPSALFCQGNTLQLCSADGATSTLYQTCATNWLCNPATTMCAVPRCTPNQPACDGSVFTTCNADGFGYTGTRTDCTALDKFCGPTGCTASAVDTIPATPTLYGTALPSYAMLDFYSVAATRNLSLIEQYMSPASVQTLTWHVFESLTQTGTYTSISNTTTSSTIGAGYQASGALAVPLIAGRFYAIGVSWTTPALNFGYQSAAPTQVVSFGSLISAAFLTPPPAGTTISYVSPGSTFLPQRLTTAP
jgi:hypothetical protein